jgi:hypothetical protein
MSGPRVATYLNKVDTGKTKKDTEVSASENEFPVSETSSFALNTWALLTCRIKKDSMKGMPQTRGRKSLGAGLVCSDERERGRAQGFNM